jgi:hypothetical protein
MMQSTVSKQTGSIVFHLDRWLDSTRVDWPTPGYGGPVVHWWNHCLAYRGAGLDWRYEGIINAYLTLWRRTGDLHWLGKAIRAGDDLVTGQRPDGHFTNSRFELNPGYGGTPHEVACDAGLLALAEALADSDVGDGTPYRDAALQNLSNFAFGQLWHEQTSTFRDGLDGVTFVPNKAATFIEAVILLARLSGNPVLIERYALPTARFMLAMQVRRPGHELDGAIAQNRHGDRIVERYFPIYIARCIPALFQLAETTGEPDFHAGATAATAFLQRVQEPDGGLPMVLYPRGRRNRYPRWIAGTGDVVRAFDFAQRSGAATNPESALRWIAAGARPDGRIATAEGFGRLVPIISRRERHVGEIGVVGWCDKAFRALASHADLPTLLDPAPARSPIESRALGYPAGVVR